LSDHLARFNALPDQEAEDQLYAGFADRSWAARVASGRPYRDLDHLLDVAELAWSELKPGDWLRAFRAHPRIGEQGGHAPAVSEREQSGGEPEERVHAARVCVPARGEVLRPHR